MDMIVETNRRDLKINLWISPLRLCIGCHDPVIFELEKNFY